MLVGGIILRNQLSQKLLNLGECIIIAVGIIVISWCQWNIVGMTSDGCTGGGSIPIGTVPYDVSGLSAGITDIVVWPIGVRWISRRLICIPRAIVIIVIIVATSRSTISTIHLLDLLG